MRFEECLDKGLIKKDLLASERVESSLMIAERFLRSSRRTLRSSAEYFGLGDDIFLRQKASMEITSEYIFRRQLLHPQ